jgi:GNAT superfamily N-acetyltransferase
MDPRVSTIVRLLRSAHEAAGETFPFPFSAPHAANIAAMHLTDEDCYADLVGDYGVLLARRLPHPFAPVHFAMETVWWIDPAQRGGSLAVRMLDRYEDWSRARGCLFAQMAALATFPGAARIYERRGYRHTETHFMKVLA